LEVDVEVVDPGGGVEGEGGHGVDDVDRAGAVVALLDLVEDEVGELGDRTGPQPHRPAGCDRHRGRPVRT
jgi:hypothetical protein